MISIPNTAHLHVDYGLDSAPALTQKQKILMEESKVAFAEDRPALEVQVGGSHYKELAIQPVEFIHANGIGFLEGCIIKRITRYKTKDPKKMVEDLHKAKHEIDLLLGFIEKA